MKNYLYLILIFLILTGAGYVVTKVFPEKIDFSILSILSTGSFIIAVVTSIVFFRGFKKSEKKGVLHTLSAIGLKFLLFLALLGIFALILKEMNVAFLIAFFVCYLMFSLYLLITFVGVLKKKNKNVPDA